MLKNCVLITGGAGYIGTNIIEKIKGRNIVCLDNFSNSFKQVVERLKQSNEKIIVEECDLLDVHSVENIFSCYEIKDVIHLAGKKYIQESFLKIDEYYENNVVATQLLLNVMDKFGVKNLIFSSTITVYGNAKEQPIVESCEKNPISPYAEQKSQCEEIIKNWCTEDKKAVVLRLSNPVGANKEQMLGNNGKSEDRSLLPYLFENHNKQIVLNANTHQTKDGTTIRDYIHVEDVANAFVCALYYKSEGFNIFNIGGGKEGVSVLDLVGCVEKVLNKKLNYCFGERKIGDVSVLVCNNSKAKKELNFKIEKSLMDIVESQYEFYKYIKKN